MGNNIIKQTELAKMFLTALGMLQLTANSFKLQVSCQVRCDIRPLSLPGAQQSGMILIQ